MLDVRPLHASSSWSSRCSDMQYRLPIFTLLVILVLFTESAATLSVALPRQAQPPRTAGMAGWWEWKGAWNRRHARRTFYVRLTRDGDSVQGTYSVIDWLGDTPLVEDGNQTPFRGSVRKNTATIEFDPTAVYPGYKDNVSYSPPSDGRQPSRATLTLGRGSLVWRVTSVTAIEGVPRRMKMYPSRK